MGLPSLTEVVGAVFHKFGRMRRCDRIPVRKTSSIARPQAAGEGAEAAVRLGGRQQPGVMRPARAQRAEAEGCLRPREGTGRNPVEGSAPSVETSEGPALLAAVPAVALVAMFGFFGSRPRIPPQGG